MKTLGMALWIMVLVAPGCDSSSPQAQDTATLDAGEDGSSSLDAQSDVGADEGLGDVEEVEDFVEPPVKAGSGTLDVLSYNVAGLLEGISGSKPATYSPLISPLLNPYELVLVQEDFCYHDDISGAATHSHQSAPEFDPACTIFIEPGRNFGDGLNRFSQTPFGLFERFDWSVCHGEGDCASDCLTPKGFTFARHVLESGATVDVYNLHMDASKCEGSIAARATQAEQLAELIETRSADRAVIVAGDTNLKPNDPERPGDTTTFDTLLADAGLTDGCRALECGDERIDRVLFRSSDTLTLTPTAWSIPSEFVDGDGNDLSDHEPVLVTFSWESTP